MAISDTITSMYENVGNVYDVLGLAGAKGTELPIGYTQVDYIESNGTQYIDTLLKLSATLDIDVEFEIVQTAAWQRVFGLINAGNVFQLQTNGGSATDWRFNYNGSNYDISNLTELGKKTNFKFISGEGLYVNNVLKQSIQTTTSLSNGTIGLFKGYDRYSHIKIYSCKIYDNNVLIRDYVPCYRNSDNEVGLYDLVNDVFYTNQGTGAFTYGSVVLNRNIQNLKQAWEERLLYFLANGTDVVWNNWEKVSGSGTTLSLNNTIEAKMDFVYKGNTYQYSTTGKNLISTNINDLEQGTILGNDGTNASSNNRVRNNRFFNFDYDEIQPNHVWLVPTGYKIAIRVYDQNKNFVGTPTYSGFLGDLPSAYVGLGIKYIKIVYAKTDDSNITPNDIANLEFMISKGNDTSYEPYTGNQPSPNPDYPQDIQVVSGDNSIRVCNKNLYGTAIKTDNMVGSSYNIITDTSDKLEIQGISNYYSGIYKKYQLQPNTQYTISLKYSQLGSKSMARIYYKLGNDCENIATNDNNGYIDIGTTRTSLTFTTDSIGLVAIMFMCNLDTNLGYVVYNDIQLEKGQATTYEPYQSASYPISLGNIELCKIGTYQDSIVKDNGKWYLNKQIGKVVLDGSETGWNEYIQDGVINCFNNSLITFTNQNGFSNYFTLSTDTSYSNTKPRLILFNTLRGFGIYASINIFATLAQLKTWLSTHNTTVYYVLATPTYEEITDSTLIYQLEAIKKSYNTQTNISQTNADKPFILDVTALKDLDAEDTTPTLTTNQGLLFTQPPVSENFINDEDDNSILEETINEEEPNIEDDNREEEEPLDFFEKEIINNDEEQEEIPTEPIEIDNGQR